MTQMLTHRAKGYVVAAAGGLIGLILLILTGMADGLAAHVPVGKQPAALFVALMIAAGIIYSSAALLCGGLPDNAGWRRSIVVMAIGMRLCMMTGTPILEDDHYRYLWDGALVARGINPYRHAPIEALDGTPSTDASILAQLAEQSGPILDRINHPWLRTIYPPAAQAAFGLAHILSPWQMWGWRLVLAVFEISTLLLLYRLKVPLVGLLVYGWNPLLIKEVYNSGHVDALMLPFLLLAAVAAHRNRPLSATAAVGMAGGIKLWPLILMPMLWRRLTNRPLLLAASLTLFAALFTASLLPMLLQGWDQTSGLAAYVRYWEMNDALYTLIAWGVDGATALLPLSPPHAVLMPRLAAAAVVAAGVVWLARHRQMEAAQQFLAATTLLFVISPTQFPWYYLWLLPFLALHPHPALIVYAALLPLYYLRPLLAEHQLEGLFDRIVVWLQHGPVVIWLFRDWVWRRQLDTAGA